MSDAKHSQSCKESVLKPTSAAMFTEPQEAGSLYLKRWLKTSHGIIMILSNSLVQVRFKDRTELFVNKPARCVTYVDREQHVTTISAKEALSLAEDHEMAKRLRYVKNTLAKDKKPTAEEKEEPNFERQETRPDHIKAQMPQIQFKLLGDDDDD